MKFQYPLQWLNQQPRTKNPRRSNFGNHSSYKAGVELENELKRLGAKNILVSSDMQSKADGTLCVRQYNEDKGIVIYFELKGSQKAMACDKWDRPEHNLWALKTSISAIRGLERWGGSEFLDGLFTGFQALPAPEDITISNERYFTDCTNLEYLGMKYKKLLKEMHPDNLETGDSEKFQDMMAQYKQAKDNLE